MRWRYMKYNRKIALCMLGLMTVIGICGNTGHNVQASEEMVDEEVTVFDDEEEQIELELSLIHISEPTRH